MKRFNRSAVQSPPTLALLRKNWDHIQDELIAAVDGNYGVATEHVFLGRGARRVAEPASGDLEEMEILLVPLAEIAGRLGAGEIAQLSSAAALALGVLELSRPAATGR